MCQRHRARSFPSFAPLSFLGLSLAVAVGLLAFRAGSSQRSSDPQARAVCIDRDGDRLVFLGAGGRLLAELPTVAPVFASEAPPAPGRKGAGRGPDHWVIEALQRRAGGEHAVCRLSVAGERRELARVPGPVAAAHGPDEVWILAGAAEDRWLWRVGRRDVVQRLLPMPRAESLASGPSELLISSAGTLSIFDRSPAPVLRRERAIGGPVGGMAACADGWWVFFGEARELWRLDRELRPVRVHVVSKGAAWLGARGGKATLVEQDSREDRGVRGAPVLRTYAIDGSVELSPRLYISDARALALDRQGDVLVATHGAVFGLDAHLELVWSQGGFAWLTGFAQPRVGAPIGVRADSG